MEYIKFEEVPGWPYTAPGLYESCEKVLHEAGFKPTVIRDPNGLLVSDANTVRNFLTTYSGSAHQLAHHQTLRQTALDKVFDERFDFHRFLRIGAAPVTPTEISNFIAQVANNYRSLRAQIASATTPAAVDAVDINSGWPANP